MTKKRTWKKYLFSLFIITILIGSGVLLAGWYVIFKSNVQLNDSFFYIKTGSTFEDVVDSLDKKNVLENMQTFLWVAKQKNYPDKIKPGKYLLKKGMNNNELVNLFRSGNQVPVHIEFNSIRTAEQLAGRLSKQIEADSISIINILNDTAYLQSKGFDMYNKVSVFIPNTYEIWWNTSAQQLFDKMYKEYTAFWNSNRLSKAKELKLTPNQVITLASIVEQETSKNDEKPKVAGVYLNRLKSNMALQADPTLIFAAGDFSIRRVLNYHKEIESPYNTYKYTGLPPGPICIPAISSIDAVLNPDKHNYVFFCAKEDFSGYHNFALSYNEHLINARKYQAALNRRKIMK